MNLKIVASDIVHQL